MVGDQAVSATWGGFGGLANKVLGMEIIFSGVFPGRP